MRIFIELFLCMLLKYLVSRCKLCDVVTLLVVCICKLHDGADIRIVV